MKILVVDDSKPIYMMVSSMLEENGHEHLWAVNGKDAISKVGLNKDIDLILLDWNMPEMDGADFLRVNQKDQYFSGPIIMMTTENKPERIKEAMELGVAEYIMKPFTSDILFNKIELAMEDM